MISLHYKKWREEEGEEEEKENFSSPSESGKKKKVERKCLLCFIKEKNPEKWSEIKWKLSVCCQMCGQIDWSVYFY